MQNHAEPLLNSESGQFKAVCHKCQYVGFEANVTTCRQCGFPLLIESASSAQLTVREILDRSSIELKGGRQTAPLPGINRTERQKRQMLENARRRMTTGSIPEPAPALVDRTGQSQQWAAQAAQSRHRTATEPPVYSERDETFIFRAQQRADTYQVQSYPQEAHLGLAATIDLRRRPRVGMAVAVGSALLLTLVTAAGL